MTAMHWPRATLVALLAAAAVVLVLLAVVAASRNTTPIVTNADLAVTEFYTELATRGQLRVGPYSRFGWHHPGPLYFYLLVPVYAASGHQTAALFSAAVAINLAAILTLVWIVAREKHGGLAVLLAIGCLVFAWRVPRLLASPWTAHVPVLASLAFVAVCGAVVGGRYRLLPAAIAAGSFIVQTHVGYGPMVGALSSVAGLAVFRRAKSDQWTRWRILGLAAGTWLLLWIAPVTEALSHGGGNLAAMWQFFMTAEGTAPSATAALGAWSHGLLGILRPDVSLPWGGHFVSANPWWTVPLALAQLVALSLIAFRGFRSERRFEGGLAACAGVASVVGLWATAQIRGDILDHEIFPLTALGVLNLAVIGTTVLRLLVPAPLGRWVRSPQVAIGVCAVVLIGCVQLGAHHFRDFTAFELRRSERARIPATYELIRDFLSREALRRPIIQMEGDAWSEGAGILLRLLQAGVAFSLDEGGVRMFTEAFTPTGDEDVMVNLATREGIHQRHAVRPGNVVLRDRNPLYVDAVRLNGHRQSGR